MLYREIKTNKNFKRISLGTFALQEYKQKKQLPEIIKGNIRMHSYIEGLMVELGNYEKFDTYCADPSNEYQDFRRIQRVNRELESGIICVNEGIFSNEFGPFGGVKESGIGREGSVLGIEEYLETKYTLISYK